MPNTFGRPSKSAYSGAPGSSPSPGRPSQFFPIYDPRTIRASRARFFRDDIEELRYANSFYTVSGVWPSRGWILMRFGDYNQFNVFATDFQLQIDDFIRVPLIFQNLAIVQARCVTTGVPTDPEAIYLVEIADGQGILYNRWFQQATTSQYNVRAPAYQPSFSTDPQQFYTNSLRFGTDTFTWNYMVQDLWNQCTPFLGVYPGLPITPAGTPENFSFPGVSVWDALNDVVNMLGLAITSDHTGANPYNLVVSGAADPVFTALQAHFLGNLEDDLQWIDAGSARMPLQVVVFFHRRNQFYGTEETVRRDALQWQTTPLYSVTVQGPFPNAVGTAYLWDDFTVRYDVDGNPLTVDTVTAMSIAQERTTQFYNRITRGTSGFMRQTYAGALPFITGSLVDGVRWYQDFTPPQERSGWRTEIVRGYFWNEIQFELDEAGIKGA